MVWGLDLVEMQLLIAAGEALPFEQSDLRPRGHAMEARIYAEDADRGFLPTGGTVLVLDEPLNTDNVRVDSSLLTGTEIGSNYDPMLSKIIAWGPNRNTALRTLRHALGGTTILGVTTNVGFLRRILAHPDVISGRLDTNLVERVMEHHQIAPVPDEISAAAALITLVRDRRGQVADDPWDDRSGWRIGGPAWTTYRARSAGDGTVVVRHRGTATGFDVAVDDGAAVPSAIAVADGIALIGHGGAHSQLTFARLGRTLWIGRHGETWHFAEADPTTPGGSADAHQGGTITSPMPGTVAATPVVSGDVVVTGQAVVVVEAMKMEHTLRAAFDGTVIELLVAVGDRVALNQALAVIEPFDDTPTNESTGDR